MLTSLRIKHLAVVDEATVTLAPGLNVITGETGAGKSMLADALNLLLGERADKSLIRTGETQCQAEAVFELEKPEAVNALLEEAGLDPCEDGMLLIRRTISANGPSRVLLNDTPVTLQLLKRIGVHLVDMHGPHEHQSLLDPRFQREILDAFGTHDHLLAAYHAPYARMLALQSELASFHTPDGDTAAQLDLLAYQIQELEAADLEHTDEEALLDEHSQVANATRILELADTISSALTGDEEGAFNGIVAAKRAATELASLMSEAEDWLEALESLSVQATEISNAVGALLHRIDPDPERLTWLEDRMALLQKLKRKYGGSVQDMQAFLTRAQARHQKLASRESRIAEIEAEQARVQEQLQQTGKALRAAREKNAKRLARDIEQQLHDLGFAHGQFSIRVLPADTPGPDGLDQIDFGFAPNPGEELRALKAIASSGEISRVMLALKAVLARHDKVPVLLFDEIDANLGGEMGNAVGRKLATVASAHQVLCITHLPQVAVCGQHHLVVQKAIRDGRTYVGIEPATGDARASEIARMLGGQDLTSVTLQHAREMLQGNTHTP